MKVKHAPLYVYVGRHKHRVDVRRVLAKIRFSETGCWLWTASLDRHGYGQLMSRGSSLRAHRVVYEIFVGPIARGLDLDHVKDRGCCYHHCVRPAHLEPVTRRENLHRGIGDRGSQTHCHRGHAFTKNNTYWRRDRPNERLCRTCRRENLRALYARRKAKS